VRRFDYYFRETATGLRRNGVIAFAAMSTAFIALFLFGLALLIGRELNLVIEAYTGNVEVAVYLTDPVNSDTVSDLTADLQRLDAVESVVFESKLEACERAEDLFQNQPAFRDVPCDVWPASLRVGLRNTALFEQIPTALDCRDEEREDGSTEQVCGAQGVDKVADFTELLRRLTSITRVLSFMVLAIASIMLTAAIVLIANTLRMGMFARRREIGIMRLVGATNWRIRVPFLIEGLVESLFGAILAVVALFLVKVLAIDALRDDLRFLPFIGNSDVLAIGPWIATASAVVAVIAGTIGMRRFLDV
jgi:cell division transport system permease protein